tara:strand:+ start:127 stop:444 length:318 start_codon:yes stop_codon:yes gene_type:complete
MGFKGYTNNQGNDMTPLEITKIEGILYRFLNNKWQIKEAKKVTKSITISSRSYSGTKAIISKDSFFIKIIKVRRSGNIRIRDFKIENGEYTDISKIDTNFKFGLK